ncbi:hypothetical protein [Frigoriglobus tundricola]|uniref:Uncharacterized protein n=1 Tax=Frigoriglobus tundricola TaxID=2774151 RepID=A0A6M5YTM2_9BACT|nr:hypothetical protein [Frigoriglobus tundricola]QJW96720.1 hypothetical protein FTUN_4279 [Frigoriglobus tundricola]
MAYVMIVQLPVTGAYGSDEDFDLRTQLERDLASALARARAGEVARGEIDGGRMSVVLESFTDVDFTLGVVKDVLARLKQLHRATVVLETNCEADPDDVDRETLWPIRHTSPVRIG